LTTPSDDETTMLDDDGAGGTGAAVEGAVAASTGEGDTTGGRGTV
jgi:hypothetical protein